MNEKKISYRPLASSGTQSDDETISSSDNLLQQNPPRRKIAVQAIIIYFLLGLNVVLIITLLAVPSQHPTDADCTKRLSLYSPALDAVEYVNADFVNDFNVTSIYRGPPTPEREEAWDKLTYKHGIEVPTKELAGLNRSESDNLKHVPADVGTGYVAILEVFHQLHCLNMIRMYTWWLVDKYPGIPDGLSMSPLKNRMHVDHCIESLRISLQCAADVTPVLVKLGGPVGSKADFSSHHRCRNFDKIENWIDENWTVN